MLLTPGPVPVLDEISKAQCKPMITHRSTEFSELYGDLVTRLKYYFGADEAYVLTGSGALGLETLVLNLCEKNDNVICFPNGDFGEKQVQTVQVYANSIANKIEEGKGWDLERTKATIDSSDAKVLAIVYNETSLGVTNHIKEICKYAKSKDMLTIVDGISAWPGTEFNMKNFYVDAFVSGSQKGIASPPGMSLIGLSKDAIERFTTRNSIPSYYCDLRRHKKRFEKDKQTPNTPAISLFWALQKAFDVLDNNGGLNGCVKRHKAAAEHTRKRILGMGLDLIAEKGFESNTVTGFVCPVGISAKDVRNKLLAEYKIQIVGARGKFKDNGLRIAHMGNFDLKDIDFALDKIERIIK
ncbi:alanine--glyoxylate aminotransferase family protein [Candidatus Micrarchaeota archaeon]|nr:alanine--glyoxylate aminotransferase family protein [Candidatus Micrarchaeota archaeon]MBU1166169.1 alanine--glyoxylate aminotransferase family protein [Candidatus Micrarchaeota archaeon]MBU1886567.1 alanine--glyoxylate aminotransferase family protein [Candidatus Micrarchaeota archaeon]